MKFSSKVFFSLISATFIFAAGCDDGAEKCTAKCDGQTAMSCDKNGKSTKKTCNDDQKCEVNTKANTAACKAKGNNNGGNNGGTGGEYKDCNATQAKRCEGLTGVKCLVTPAKIVICAVEPEQNCTDTAKKCDGDHLKGCWLNQKNDPSKGGKVTLQKCAKGCENNQCKGGGGGGGGGAETCDPKNYESQCAEDLKSGTFCNKSGKVGKVNCSNADCQVSPTGFVSCGEPKSDVYVDCVLDKHKAKCKDLTGVKCMVKDKDVNNENNARVVCFKDPEDKCENDANDKCELVEGKAINDMCYFKNYPLKKDGLRSLQVCAKGCADNNKKCKE